MRIFSLYLSLTFSLLLWGACSGQDTAQEDSAPADVASEERASPSPSAPELQNTDDQVILILGNSITAGYGLNPEQAFPALLQEKIDSLDWDFHVVNAGLSGETSAGGLRRVEWLLRQPADVLVIELGGNDGLRGISPEATKDNLIGIIERAREINPNIEIILAGMQIPPNLGPEYASRFRSIYPEIAREEDVLLIPFILEGVGGVPELNLSDGIHPTARGHRIVAENVWQTLRPLLEILRPEHMQAAR